MATKKPVEPRPNNTEIRRLMLKYFYDRNSGATSARGKRGSAVKISDVKRELKAAHGLSQQEVQSNLTYLMSEHWVEEETIEKTFTAARGTAIPSITSFYKITAAGIDKVEGPGEFTMAKFHDIKIEATGQNIITVGDGNQVNATFEDLGQALAALREAVVESSVSENEKFDTVADLETIQSQLAKRSPSKPILVAAWEAVRTSAAVNGAITLVERVQHFIGPML